MNTGWATRARDVQQQLQKLWSQHSPQEERTDVWKTKSRKACMEGLAAAHWLCSQSETLVYTAAEDDEDCLLMVRTADRVQESAIRRVTHFGCRGRGNIVSFTIRWKHRPRIPLSTSLYSSMQKMSMASTNIWLLYKYKYILLISFSHSILNRLGFWSVVSDCERLSYTGRNAWFTTSINIHWASVFSSII